jgi:hypothetical protein
LIGAILYKKLQYFFFLFLLRMVSDPSRPNSLLQDVVLFVLGGLVLLCLLITVWLRRHRGRADSYHADDLRTDLNDDETFHGPPDAPDAAGQAASSS